MGNLQSAIGLMQEALVLLDRAGNQSSAAAHLQHAIDIASGASPPARARILSLEQELRLEALLDQMAQKP